MSMMVSFVLSFFPRDVLDEILKLIESVSEDFPSYSFNPKLQRPWKGPMIVVEQLNDVLFRIQSGPKNKPMVVHHDKLFHI